MCLYLRFEVSRLGDVRVGFGRVDPEFNIMEPRDPIYSHHAPSGVVPKPIPLGQNVRLQFLGKARHGP